MLLLFNNHTALSFQLCCKCAIPPCQGKEVEKGREERKGEGREVKEKCEENGMEVKEGVRKMEGLE